MIQAATADRYDHIGQRYAVFRQQDLRIADQVRQAIGDADTLLNVGAGTGNYEPHDLDVVAVEPSTVMIAQRPAGSAPVARGVAESFRSRRGHSMWPLPC